MVPSKPRARCVLTFMSRCFRRPPSKCRDDSRYECAVEFTEEFELLTRTWTMLKCSAAVTMP